MPALSDYTAGTITLTNGSVNFTGAGTGWQAADFREGDTILGIEDNAGVEYVIASITGNGAGTLTQEWEGATGTYAYRMRYLADGARVTAQARNLIELLGNGNLQALAGLTGPGVPVFNGPHAMVIKPEAEFVNGVAYDVQVDTLADRAAYDGQSEGFAVLVSDIGDGRSALFSKANNTSGDWTDPAYVTGSVGPMPDVEATVDTLPPGSTATVTPTPITGGVRLDFELPGASGFYNAGVYDIAEAYNQDDVVRHNGSSFIALQAVPGGTSPSSAMPPVDTAYWQVLAAKGQDGAGTVSSVVAGTGISVDNTDPTAPEVSVVAFTGDSGSGGVLGGVPAPAAGDAVAGKVLGAGGAWVIPASVPRGHIYGLTLSNNATDATNDIDVATGEAASDGASPGLLTLGSALTKRLDAAWAVGSGNGGLDTGSITDTTYHVWLIRRSDTGLVDVLFSTSASAPAMPTNYDQKRRIGSILRISGAIKAFKQVGDEFLWVYSVADVSGSASAASAATVTLTVPTGIVVDTRLSVLNNSSGPNIGLLLSPLEVADVLPGTGGYTSNATAVADGLGSIFVRTNTSAQIRRRESGAGSTISIWTEGWVDRRGRL